MKHISTEIVNITPKQAKAWLDGNNQNNRPMRIDAARKFARDMKSGNWSLTHQGIAFYDDGTIADGQHRLMGVVLAEKPVKFLVTKNLPKSSGAVIDQNVPRQAYDSIIIAGGPSWINRSVVAIIRFAMTRLGNKDLQLTTSEIMTYAFSNEENLKFADSLCNNRKRQISSAGMAANYYCAILGGEDKDKLRRFSEVMSRGEISGPSENAAIRLREYLITNNECWNGQMRMDTSKRAQRAIHLFCKGQPIAKLYCPAELTYAIPE
jgi:hypothetical protein